VNFRKLLPCFLQQAENSSSPTLRAIARVSNGVIGLAGCLGRVLAQEIRADRPYPPFDRSNSRWVRRPRHRSFSRKQRYAASANVKAGDASANVHRALASNHDRSGGPQGADAVVMIEHTRTEAKRLAFDRPSLPPAHRSAWQGAAGAKSFWRAAAASVLQNCRSRTSWRWCNSPFFANRASPSSPRADECSPPRPRQATSNPHSNAYSLRRTSHTRGGEPVVLANAKDTEAEPYEKKSRKVSKHDMLILSGGVSAGKYDSSKKSFAIWAPNFS